MAAIPEGDAKTRGLALGAEVAAGMVANRANDGRSVLLAPYVPGTEPGKFRGVNPISRYFPSIRPFTLTSVAQFRPPPPPALDSATYAADINETKALGGAVSTARTAAQFETARFHTEAPPIYLTRNFGKFARTTSNVADAARLMAIIYTGYSDAIDACFEAKYFYEAWRPQSAIPLADTDNNPATIADPAWTPSVPTPNHPEYPAAHSCTAGALGELLLPYYRTEQRHLYLRQHRHRHHAHLHLDRRADRGKQGGAHLRRHAFPLLDDGRRRARQAVGRLDDDALFWPAQLKAQCIRERRPPRPAVAFSPLPVPEETASL